MNIKLTGLQRTGTNYVRQILEKNITGDVKVCDYIGNRHKHEFISHAITSSEPYDRSSVDLNLLVVKNPYLWVESIASRNKVDIINCHGDYQLHWLGHNVGKNLINLHNLCRLYRDFYTEWLAENVVLCKYESYLTIQGLEHNFKILEQHGLIFNDSRVHVLQEVDYSNPKDIGDLENYKSQTEIYLSKNDIDIITQTISPELITNLGYSVK